jgi:hypothetical protein
VCGGVCQCVHMCVRAWLWLRYTHTHTHTQTHTHKAAADKVERGDAEARDCKFISLFFFNFITTGRSRQGKTRRGRSGRFQICAGARRLGPGTARRGNKKQDMACSRYVQCQKRPTTVSKETYYMYNMPASPGPGQLEGEIKNKTWLVAGMCICMYVCMYLSVCLSVCVVCLSVCLSVSLRVYMYNMPASPVRTYYSVKRDLLQCQKRPTTVSKETYYMYNMPASPVRTCTPWSNDTSRSLLMTLVGLFCITCLPPLYARVRLGQMCGN